MEQKIYLQNLGRFEYGVSFSLFFLGGGGVLFKIRMFGFDTFYKFYVEFEKLFGWN